MKIIKIEENKYPENLRKIKNPPQKLYVLGNEHILNNNSIAIVGSRVCTQKGANIAKNFAEQLSMRNICIISGMAKGIDSAAHIGALNAGGKTIAILGSGFNNIFPKQNIPLFNKIIENGGAIVTEYEPDVKVFSNGFVQRNRIISGLSKGILIVEAKNRSGTSITAKFAKEQSKKIFCIAHGIEDKEGIGTNRLIQKGAFLVTKPEDIINQFEEFKNTEVVENTIKKYVPDEYLQIYEIIEEEPIHINEISKKLNIDVSKINYALTMLEIGEYIESLPRKIF